MTEIKNKDGAVIRTVDADTLTRAKLQGADLRDANLRDADLYDANLSGANLSYADLNGANLHSAKLRGVDLSCANLRGADLRCADLRDADLRGANMRDTYLRYAKLDGALIDWTSHDIIAEILRQAAGNDADKRMIAGLIWMSRDWCWDEFVALAHPLQDWAMGVLSSWNTEANPMPKRGTK